MTVHQVKAATSELQLHDLLLGLQLAGDCLHLVHGHGLPLEVLVRSSPAGYLSRRRVGKRKRPRKERLTPLPR